MRQTIGMESAASCSSIANTCHLWRSSGPILEATGVLPFILVANRNALFIPRNSPTPFANIGYLRVLNKPETRKTIVEHDD